MVDVCRLQASAATYRLVSFAAWPGHKTLSADRGDSTANKAFLGDHTVP